MAGQSSKANIESLCLYFVAQGRWRFPVYRIDVV